MHLFEKFAGGLAKILYYFSGIAIVAMMLLTSADIVLRLFRRPIPGTYELVCYMGAIAASFALAHTSIEKGHVEVSFLVDIFPRRIQGIIGSITDLLAMALFAVISWQSCIYAIELKAGGEVSQTIQLPFYPFVFGLGFAAAAVVLVLFVNLVRNIERQVLK